MKKVIHHNYWYWGETYYIILDNGNGTVTIQIDNDNNTSGCITCLSVTDNVRNKGLGNKLIQECKKLAKELGLEEIYLTAEKDSFVFDWYKRKGFNKDKYRNKYLYRLTKQL